MIVRELGRSTTSEMVLEEIAIERLEESHSGVHLMSDICTIGILLDEFCDFFESSLCLSDACLELGFVWSHYLCSVIYLTIGYGYYIDIYIDYKSILLFHFFPIIHSLDRNRAFFFYSQVIPHYMTVSQLNARHKPTYTLLTFYKFVDIPESELDQLAQEHLDYCRDI